MFSQVIRKTALCVALTVAVSSQALAATEIPFWHSMEGELGKEVDSLAGLRLGWAIMPTTLLNKVAIIKQAADLHASALSQSIVECYLGLDRLDAQIDIIRHAYKQKGQMLANLVQQELGDQITFDMPQGGMFLWAKFRKPINTSEWLKETLKQGVVFVPGEYFFSDKPDHATFRLSFATVTEEQMQEAVARLKRSLGGCAGL